MGVFKRNTIVNSGLKSLSEKYINDNFMALFSKVSGGNINYSDMDSEVQNKLQKQWIPFQSEGNLDASYPLYARFYCPPEVKEVKKATVSVIVTKYRMDSGVANSTDLSINGDININMGGGGGAIMNGIGSTAPVSKWGTRSPNTGLDCPTAPLIQDTATMVNGEDYGGTFCLYAKGKFNNSLGIVPVQFNLSKIVDGVETEEYADGIDVLSLQHTHELPPQSVTLPNHDHTGSANFTLPAHTHPLNEGIKQSTVEPQNVKLIINGTQIGIAMNGDGTIQNDIDFLTHVNIGAWNNITITSDTVARVSLYGVVELIQQYSKLT